MHAWERSRWRPGQLQSRNGYRLYTSLPSAIARRRVAAVLLHRVVVLCTA